MTDNKLLIKVDRLQSQILNRLALIGAFFLGGVVVMTIGDVLMRLFFNHPFSGSLELAQIFTVPLIWLGVAYTMRVGGHVRMEMLSDLLFKNRKNIVYWIFIRLALLMIIILLCIAAFDAAAYSFRTREITDILEIPVYPFKWLLFAGSLFFVLELLIELAFDVESLHKRAQGGDNNG